MGRPFVRARDWEIGCYIYDNFFEIQVVLKMACVDELSLKGDWGLTINRKRGLRQWRSDIERY